MNAQYNESDWGWFIDLEHNEATIYKPLIRSSLPTIHEYEYTIQKIIGKHVDLENNDTKGCTETNAYTMYKPSIPTIREYHLQIFINGNVVQKIIIPWSEVENFGLLFMVFMLYSLYKYHVL